MAITQLSSLVKVTLQHFCPFEGVHGAASRIFQFLRPHLTELLRIFFFFFLGNDHLTLFTQQIQGLLNCPETSEYALG